MKNVVNRAFMAKKKTYSKPTTETLDLRVENLMLNVSINEGSGEQHPQAGMPRRGSAIP